jgi:hypothetical protein
VTTWQSTENIYWGKIPGPGKEVTMQWFFLKPMAVGEGQVQGFREGEKEAALTTPCPSRVLGKEKRSPLGYWSPSPTALLMVAGQLDLLIPAQDMGQ